uniref:DRBM domain-containing protein n=1 Tax=Picornavirales sp. TaxID=1955153 RepID=A0A514D1W4_9VIRU|nr:MAG: hypothetical protein H4RhizoLitter211311_000002 [Picornavirales sp.]
MFHSTFTSPPTSSTNPIGDLNEHSQREGVAPPIYVTSIVGGPDHSPQFICRATYGMHTATSSVFLTKKDAERGAAVELIKQIQQDHKRQAVLPKAPTRIPFVDTIKRVQSEVPIVQHTDEWQVKTMKDFHRHLDAVMDYIHHFQEIGDEKKANELVSLVFEQLYPHAQMSDVVVQKGENKAVSETVDTLVGITTLDDTVGKPIPDIEISSHKGQSMHGEDPYPDQQMKTILSRLYPIDNWAWSGSSTSGTLLISYHFPNALINASTNLQEKLHRFQYLRAAVRVLIRLNATKFHAGKLLVTWVPCYKKGTTDSNAMQDMYSASCNNSVIVSANTTVPVDFIIPWVTPYSYWNMRDSYATTAQGLMGYIKVWVLHPLILAGASNTPSCNVTLYASFVDPEVAGPGLRNNDPRSDQLSLRMSRHVNVNKS